MDTQVPNPLVPERSLKRPFEEEQSGSHPAQPTLPEDSAVAKAEKVASNGTEDGDVQMPDSESPSKNRTNLDPAETVNVDARGKVKGVALVKAE